MQMLCKPTKIFKISFTPKILDNFRRRASHVPSALETIDNEAFQLTI
jgi:hypothetical protein